MTAAGTGAGAGTSAAGRTNDRSTAPAQTTAQSDRTAPGHETIAATAVLMVILAGAAGFLMGAYLADRKRVKT